MSRATRIIDTLAAISDLQRQVDVILARWTVVVSLPLSPPTLMWPPTAPLAPAAWLPSHLYGRRRHCRCTRHHAHPGGHRQWPLRRAIGCRLTPSRRRPQPRWRPSWWHPSWRRPYPYLSPRRGWRRRHNRSILPRHPPNSRSRLRPR